MPLLATNTTPSQRQLTQFSFVAAAIIVVATWWITRSTNSILVSTCVGTLLATIGVIRPEWLKPVFVLMVLAATPISFILGEVILTAVYFGIFFPLATVFRIIGRDPLMRRNSGKENSYWKHRKNSPSAQRYFRQS